jgi:hypothetical protein
MGDAAQMVREFLPLDVNHCASMFVGVSCRPFCVRTVSHTPLNPGATPQFRGTHRHPSMLREGVDRTCVGGI